MLFTKINLVPLRLFMVVIFGVMFEPGMTVQAQLILAGKDEAIARSFVTLLQRPDVAANPSFQATATDSVLIERGTIQAEANEAIPVLIYKPVRTASTKLPVVICLHGTGGSKDQNDIRQLMMRFVKKGIMAVAIDARFHGDRIAGGPNCSTCYTQAITRAWENKDSLHQSHPFLYDTVYDLWRLTDYLVRRPDVAKDRIGMTGISMGGIETWLAAAVDSRIKVAVPIIAVQSFKWSLEHDQWQGRAHTIWAVHQRVTKDRGDSTVTRADVETLWNKIVPGITGMYDCPSMLRLIAPRPLLLLSAEKDVNCPLGGAEVAFRAATDAYRLQQASGKLAIRVTPNETHHLIAEHVELAIDWFSKWL